MDALRGSPSGSNAIASSHAGCGERAGLPARSIANGPEAGAISCSRRSNAETSNARMRASVAAWIERADVMAYPSRLLVPSEERIEIHLIELLERAPADRPLPFPVRRERVAGDGEAPEIGGEEAR